jgi:transposase
MFKSSDLRLTELQKAFLEPTGTCHREVAAKFGYTAGSFRVLCHQFRQNPHRPFFLPDRDASRRTRPPKQPKKTSRLHEQVVQLRKQNLSIYDIVRALREKDETLSAPAVWAILHEEGFAKLPRRRDDERPAGVHPTQAAVAAARLPHRVRRPLPLRADARFSRV